ncbi:MAG: NAD(P)/FAD-dependent oxidoreductase [Myxococcales bacterium]|nr:NAD(P)/FAD-dependent oxidoreductase [Myxococcales bacterium]
MRILIIGSGFAGLCLGIQLKRKGFQDFTILEKADSLGGTWRDNTYPGAACDSPAFQYCFSFEQKTDWSARWVPQQEILAYQQHCADKYGLAPHLRFGCEVRRADYDEHACRWRVQLASGGTLEADVLVSAVGQLSRPREPELPGRELFRGEIFHTARWNHDFDLAGKRVAVLGNAASAIQLVPHVALQTEQLHVFQRSPNWMLPQGNKPYGELAHRLLGALRPLAWLYRAFIYLSFEARWPLFRGRRDGRTARKVKQMALDHIRAHIDDPAMQEALTPDYPLGGKRVLISDDYYPTLARSDVELVTAPFERLTEDAIITRDGTRREVDAVILATGFETTDFLAPIEIVGTDGQRLHDSWQEGARAYLGMTVPAFPNFFVMYGPNTNLGHNSIIFMIECQSRYILDCLRKMQRGDLKALEVRPEVAEAFDRQVQQELAVTPWADTGGSWYKNEAGRITNNWSRSTLIYYARTRRADLDAYATQKR